jgi:selenium metabolism protein YedF
MMSKIIDARGLTCPAPVLLVKNAVEQGGKTEITVLVDNEASCENVTRFLGSQSYTVIESREGTDFKLQALYAQDTSEAEIDAVAKEYHEEADQKILLLITTDRLGSGDDELGGKLMINYLKTIKEMGPDLWQIIFVNGGVKLTVESSPVLAELQEYEQAGVMILACGTCLEHFGLTAQKKVGVTTNMLDIVTATQLAGKVVTLG